jgi:AraC-like DNA-binding protein
MYLQFPVPDDLKHLVSFFYAMEYHQQEQALQPLLPSGTEINGWQYSGHWRVKFHLKKGAKDLLLPKFYLVGQQTVSYSLTAVAGIFGAALQPGTATLLTGIPAVQFTNNPLPSEQAFPEKKMESYIHRFSRLHNHEERRECLIDFYRQFKFSSGYRLYREALQVIYDNKACISVKELCEKLHVNERYLQREFRQHIGVPPSAYLQVMRFNNVFTELSLSREKQNLKSLAMLFNYYDLSHFNKEHQRYFGMAPSQLILERFVLLKELINQGPYLLQVQLNAKS